MHTSGIYRKYRLFHLALAMWQQLCGRQKTTKENGNVKDEQ